MNFRSEDQLQSLDQILSQQNVKKACTLGTIIDSTNAYFDYKENKFVKKIKIIDESMNTSKTTAQFRYGYCTVMFFAENIENLPNPFSIGDILYLRRFAFQVYDQSFQARSNPASYCSWALLHGDIEKGGFSEYQLSKASLNLNEEKYISMKDTVRSLREFSRIFLQKHSVLLTVSAGVNPKDKNLIVQVVRKNQQGILRVRDGKKQMIVQNCPSFVEERQIGKLRSVASIFQNLNGENEVINNKFTSLLRLPQWTSDAQKFLQQQSAMQIEEQTQMYTDLSYLNSAPLSQIEGKIFYLRCQVFNASAKSFKDALKYYDAKKNSVFDSSSDGLKPIYKLCFSCQDSSNRHNTSGQLNDIWLFTFDDQGSDFVERVDLSMLNEFSSLKQQNLLFEKKINDILESQDVRMTVEILNDGRGNRAFRALSIKC